MLEQYGYNVELQDKSRADDAVKKAFIKDDSIIKMLKLAYANKQGTQRNIRIKLEIDTNPTGGGEFESAFIGIDWKLVKEDIAPFTSPEEQVLLSKWSVDFFLTALKTLSC